MGSRLKLGAHWIEASSDRWRVDESSGEPVLQFDGRTHMEHMRNPEVALIDCTANDYSVEAEMRFVANHLPDPGAGWFGFALRAQDLQNCEIVWFMPRAWSGATVAYVPVAHGIVPWWAEAYATQKKGNVPIPDGEWFKARADVSGKRFTIYVNNELVFEKPLTYYVESGRPGFFVGTATDAEFRRVTVRALG